MQSKLDRDQEQCGRAHRRTGAAGAERVEAYLQVFFASKHKPRKRRHQSLAKNDPALAQRLTEEQGRLVPLRERRKAVVCRDRSAALITIADAVIARYRAEKDRRGLLDYDDLIEKTLALLDKVDAAWVHYKLDLGIDHVLIDEAQDTSPKQWEIIQALIGEFFAGAGARAAQAHHLRGRRREAVDLLVPGRGAARVRRRCAAHFATPAPGGDQNLQYLSIQALVPLGPERAGRRRRGVRQARSRSAG